MAPKIFITGGTGYIGGTVLDTIVKQHPDYDVTVLLRNVPDEFNERYPNVHIVKGDYDSTDTISATTSNADIVVHNGNSDHEPSIKALISGLVNRSDSSPGFLIHLSGTGIVADWRTPDHLGKLNPKIWSDIQDLDTITTRPDGELHRNVDKIIQTAASENGGKLKTAIVCPPDIYGPGRGPGRTQSVYFPVFQKEIETVGAPFYAGEGTNTRSWVHIEDLMTVYLKLVEAAVAGGGGADWGREGYYFAASQEASQIDIAKAVGGILESHGRIEDAEPKQLPLDTVRDMVSSWGIKDLGVYMFAANSRTRADRAAELFGYEPKAPSLWETMEADVLACL
ncbi:hypothetical protein LTR37_011141 [Vermiconidia calcicola]|uniref:Uncharacterized protein n=1 Tax=Vermiconidia calcicola TaxID=1690605 RepID=A0ACC3N2U8_9PEZI|nr:hypothetical protein LTR37_011141 [Vermiconidia calcicola]